MNGRDPRGNDGEYNASQAARRATWTVPVVGGKPSTSEPADPTMTSAPGDLVGDRARRDEGTPETGGVDVQVSDVTGVDGQGLEAELADCRRAYGRGAAVFADDTGGTDGEYWYALSGAGHPDYNMALVHDGDVTAHATDALERLTARGAPGVVMLAGRGLAAAQVLADSGWVSVAAMPFMRGRRDPAAPLGAAGARDVRVRPGTSDDLPRAREIFREAFGTDQHTAELVYSEAVLLAAGVEMLVAEDDDGVGCVSLVHQEGAVATNWALATDRVRRRRGMAASMIPRVFLDIDHRHPGSYLVGAATPAAEASHRTIGGEVREYWQVWSRPRWMLASA